VDSGTGLSPGAYVTNTGQLEIVGNNGTANAIAIGLSSLQLTTGSGGTAQTTDVNMPFNTIQTAVGESTSTEMVAYDSLGNPLPVTITAVLQAETSTETQYRWFATSTSNDPGNGQQGIAVGTGVLNFNGEGNFVSASNTTVTIGRANEAAVKPLQFNLDFSQVSGLATASASLSVANQDGAPPGVLNSFTISDSGLISGVFSNGLSQNLGQLRLARFTNPSGLEQQGQNLYSAGVNSGLPIIANPGDQGAGTVVAGSVEESNTDIGQGLISLITAQTMYGANAKVITTTNNLFDTLLQLLR
jgi:flagellar hook protein FlgE